MKRMMSWSLAVAFTLAAQPASALGLGSIQVHSALGQPLRAVIPVQVSKPGEGKLLNVTLASPQAYERAGISLAQLGTTLRFTVAKNAQGKPMIRVSTTDPMRVPYLEFLLKVNSPNGSILREYTLLLDPPGFNQTTGTPRYGTVSTKLAIAVQKTSNVVTAPRHKAAANRGNTLTPVKPPVSRTAGTYGPVQTGATLTAIAQATRPHGTSNDQMMLALLATNPHAFMHDNINELKRGAILRIPGQHEIIRNSPAKARAEVYRQIHEWRSRRAKAPTLVARVGGHSNVTPPVSQPMPTRSRLRLIPPAGKGGSTYSRPGVAGGTGNASIAGMKENLARANESLKSQQLHNADLSTRLSQLEKIQKENSKLLVLKNNEIAELQSKLAALRAAPHVAAIPVTASTVATTITANNSVSASGSKPIASGTLHKPTPRSIMNPAPAATATPWYRQMYVLAGGAVILLGVLIGLLLRGRRTPSPIESGSSLVDSFANNGVDGPDTELSDDPGEVADGDEDLEATALHNKLIKNPDDPGPYLELARLYYARQDSDHFAAIATAMHEQVLTDTEEWEAVAIMGEEMLPQHPLFIHPVSGNEESVAGPSITTDSEAQIEPGRVLEEFGDGSLDDAFELPSGEGNAAPVDLLAPTAEAADTSDFDWMPPELTETSPVSPDDQEKETTAEVQDQSQAGGDEPIVGNDPIETKLDLARAYLDMGDPEGAHSMLKEVLDEGSDVQKEEAQCLLEELH